MKWKIAVVLTAFALPPLIFILSLYVTASRTGLPGRRGGPQDAFRHTYASALVSRYLSPKVVHLVTSVTELDANSPHDQMDIHNNTLGAKLGVSHSGDLYDLVAEKIRSAEINTTSEDTITLMPESDWDNGL